MAFLASRNLHHAMRHYLEQPNWLYALHVKELLKANLLPEDVPAPVLNPLRVVLQFSIPCASYCMLRYFSYLSCFS